MNEKELLETLGKIDSKYIDEASPMLNVSKKRTRIVWLSAAAGFSAIIITAILFQTRIFSKLADDQTNTSTQKPSVSTQETNTNDDTGNAPVKPSENTDKSVRWPIKNVTLESSEENAPVPKWEDLTPPQKYPSAQINDFKFSGRNAKLSEQMVGKELTNVTATGFIGDTEKKADAIAYSISGIDERCAAALKFENSEDFYVYINSYYLPSTLGEFINALALEKNISFGSVSYSYFENGSYKNIEFTDLNDSVIWEMLLSDRGVKAIDNYDSHNFAASMSVSVNIPILGYENISLGITEDGYLITNILDSGKAFFIGKEKTEEFTDYVISNCTGYEIIYVSDGEEIPE